MANTWNFRGPLDLTVNESKFPSILFGEAPALGMSSTSGTVKSKTPKITNIENAPFTEADIEPIIRILSECPETVSMARVFRQHAVFGTCWYDSLIMMTFENQSIKHYIMPFVELTFRIYLENGINDLSYFSVKDRTENEIASNKESVKWLKEMGYWNNANNNTLNEPKKILFNYKLNLLASVFQKITHSPDTITIYQWQFFAKAIQKYILLGYLFHKNPDEIPKTLRQRRNSVNSISMEHLHSDLRATISANYCGADDRAIRKVLEKFTSLLNFITKDRFSIIPYSPDSRPKSMAELYPAMKPNAIPAWMKVPTIPNNWWKERNVSLDRIEGYYMILKRKNAAHLGHVICLYKCGDHWTIFDTDKGIIPLNATDSDRISTSGIKGLNYSYLPPSEEENINGILQYDFVFNDDTPLVINIPITDLGKQINRKEEYIFNPNQSYKLISKLVGAEGGKRKKRITIRKYKKKYTRKSRK